ncbi:MAG TPA: alpha/beta hydrolase [Steroidobacteraceae bacterium]|jgi:acetyl esterase/lipase
MNVVVLEPAARDLAAGDANPPFAYQLPLAVARAGLDQLQSGPAERPDADIIDLDEVAGPNGTVPVRIIRPRGSSGPLPVILYLHAGWAFGDVGTHDRLMRVFAEGAQAAIVFPSFSLSPEVRYPVAIEEVYATAQWIQSNGAQHRLDSSRVAIAGDSAGGNIATVVSMMVKERGITPFVHQLMFYPVLDPTFDRPSFAEFASGYHIPREHIMWLWDQYLPDLARRAEPWASPLRATKEQLSGLPPATIITAEADVVRDEAEAYAGLLRDAGVDVTAVRYLGTIHDFMLVDVLRHTNAARAAVTQAIAVFRSAFERE